MRPWFIPAVALAMPGLAFACELPNDIDPTAPPPKNLTPMTAELGDKTLAVVPYSTKAKLYEYHVWLIDRGCTSTEVKIQPPIGLATDSLECSAVRIEGDGVRCELHGTGLRRYELNGMVLKEGQPATTNTKTSASTKKDVLLVYDKHPTTRTTVVPMHKSH